MNAKQKLHQAKLAAWKVRFQEQADSGLTVKDWCAQNNLSIHTYNYWKHLLKNEYIDSMLPDIVPVALPQAEESQPVSVCDPLIPAKSCISRESRDSCTVPHPLHISTPDIDIAVNSSASDELLLRVIKAVRYA